MGTEPKLTPKEKEKIKNRQQYEKRLAKFANNPELKKQFNAKRAEQRANRTEEQKQRDREYDTNYHKVWRADEKNKPAKIPSQKDLASTIKPMQLQAACETASEITIQKNTSAGESKNKVHSTVEHPV